LISVLADQPLENPCAGIKRFSYKSDGNGLKCEIVYEKKPAECETLSLKVL
jgi:hypothetical protein